MQFKFLTALLLVGVCYTQMTVAYPERRSFFSDLYDEFKKLIKNIIQSAIDSYKDYLKQVSDKGEVATEEAKKLLNEHFADAQKQIDEIKQRAQDIGTDISACVTDNEDRFGNLFNKFLQDEINCITKESDEAIRIINESMTIISNTWKSIENLPEQFEACDSASCSSQVFSNFLKMQSNLPKDIKQKVNEVFTFIDGFTFRVNSCAFAQLANVGLATGAVVTDVTTCFAALIENH